MGKIGAIIAMAHGQLWMFVCVLSAIQLLRVGARDETTSLDMPDVSTPGYTTGDTRTAGGRLIRQVLRPRAAGMLNPSPLSGV